MNENENKAHEKQEYEDVRIEVLTWPYVDIISISNGSPDTQLPYR